MATTDSQSESVIEASLEPNQRQAFRELETSNNQAVGRLNSAGAREMQ